jgi:hypothetical protein
MYPRFFFHYAYAKTIARRFNCNTAAHSGCDCTDSLPFGAGLDQLFSPTHSWTVVSAPSKFSG